MSSEVPKRIIKELKKLRKDKLKNVEVEEIDNNPRYLNVKLLGAKGTPYEDGKFNLHVHLDESYPMDPPTVLFKTKIYHPNINHSKIQPPDFMLNHQTQYIQQQ